MTAKLSKLATSIVRKNPKVWLVVALAGLIVLLVMAIVSMSVVLFSGGGGFLGSLFYVADYADIDDWTELEVDLQLSFDGDTSAIGHDPFELMAYKILDITCECEPRIKELLDNVAFVEELISHIHVEAKKGRSIDREKLKELLSKLDRLRLDLEYKTPKKARARC